MATGDDDDEDNNDEDDDDGAMTMTTTTMGTARRVTVLSVLAASDPLLDFR
jgi:hypothetical protein